MFLLLTVPIFTEFSNSVIYNTLELGKEVVVYGGKYVFFPNAVIGGKNIMNKKTPTYFIHMQKGKHNDKIFRLKDSM